MDFKEFQEQQIIELLLPYIHNKKLEELIIKARGEYAVIKHNLDRSYFK